MDFVILTFLSGGDVEIREVYTIRSTILQEYTILLLMLSFEVCISTSNNTLCHEEKYLGYILICYLTPLRHCVSALYYEIAIDWRLIIYCERAT